MGRRVHIFIFALAFLIGTTLVAQIDVRTGAPDLSQYPDVRIPITIYCDYAFQENLTPSQFVVLENGLVQSPVSITCPPPKPRPPMALSMIGDRRQEMPSFAVTKMKAVYKAFVGNFRTWPNGTDVGNVVGDPDVLVKLTSNKPALRAGIDKLNPDGSISLNTIAKAINDLKTSSSGLKRYLILTVTADAIFDVSGFFAVINAARNSNVQAYVVVVYTNPLIKYYNSLMEQFLKLLAQLTGGKYYLAENQDEMDAAYRELYSLLATHFDPCTLSYTSSTPCKDGSTREVIIRFNGCSGSAGDTLYYTAPLDISTLTPVTLALDTTVINANENGELLLRLVPEQPGKVLYPFDFQLIFDNSRVTLTGITTNGYMAEGFTPIITPMPGGASVSMKGPPKILPSGNVLMSLQFRVGDPEQDENVPVAITTAAFKAGCLKQDNGKPGSILINSRKPDLQLYCDMPVSVSWDTTTFRYTPSEITITAQLQNVGLREAMNVRAHLRLPSGIELVSGDTGVAVTPSTISTGGAGTVQWTARILPRYTSDSLEICIDISADNHPPLTCCRTIFIERQGAILGLQCSVDPIRVQSGNYVPMPFRISAEIVNTGGAQAIPVQATISLPPDLKLAPGETATKNVQPYALAHNQKGTVQFLVVHPRTTEGKMYDVEICVSAPGAKPACCTVRVVIPPIPAPTVMPLCSAPDSLAVDLDSLTYAPNPFTVTTTIQNTGGLEAEEPRAVIILPPECELDPASQKDTLDITPSPLRGGIRSNPVSWTVRVRRLGRKRSLAIMIRIIGKNFDAVECNKYIVVPAAGQSIMNCSLTAPDSLELAASGAGYTPDPLRVSCRVSNQGNAFAGDITATLSAPAEFQILSPVTQTIPSGYLGPGADTIMYWDLRALPQASPTLSVLRVAINEDGLKISTCEKSVFVPSVPSSLLLFCSTPDTILYNSSTGTFQPDPFAVDMELRNLGVTDRSGMKAKVILSDGLALNSGREEVNLDSPITPGFAVTHSWSIRVIPREQSGYRRIEVIAFEPGKDTVTCVKTIYVQGTSGVALSCTVSLPDTIQFDNGAYNPDPVPVRVILSNNGFIPASDVVIILLPSGGFSPAAGETGMRTLPSPLAPGDTLSVVFFMTALPHPAAGRDSLRIMTISSGGSIVCEGWTHIEASGGFSVRLRCSAPDSIRAVSGVYTPDPALISAVVENTGAVTIRDVSLYLALSGNLVALDAVRRDIGGVGPGEMRNATWRIRALARNQASCDSATIVVTGRGITASSCKRSICVEALAPGSIEISCIHPDSLRADNGVYTPEPFRFSVVIRNTGPISTAGGSIRVFLPPGLSVASGFPALTLPPVAPFSADTITWSISTIRFSADTTVDVCVIADIPGKGATSCCGAIFIPGIEDGELAVSCRADSPLDIEANGRRYEPDPFRLVVFAKNNSLSPIGSASVSIVLPQGITPAPGEVTTKFFATDPLPPGDTDSVVFLLSAMPRSRADTLLLTSFTVTRENFFTCETSVIVPRLAPDNSLELSCTSDRDTIRFDSRTGQSIPASVSITGLIRNPQDGESGAGTLFILLPPELTLMNGETPYAAFSSLPPRGDTTAAWQVRAANPGHDTTVIVEMVLLSAGVELHCLKEIVIEVINDMPGLFFPGDFAVEAGRTVEIPLVLDPRGFALSDIDVIVRWDERFGKVVSVLNAGATASWEVKESSYPDARDGAMNVQLVNTGGRKDGGRILILRFETLPFSQGEGFSIRSTTIWTEQVVANTSTQPVRSDSCRLVVSGSCAVPLSAGDAFAILTFRPNPITSGQLGAGTLNLTLRTTTAMTRPLLVDVFDILGRVRLSKSFDAVPAGTHLYSLPVHSLPPGTYFCRCISEWGVSTFKIQVTR